MKLRAILCKTVREGLYLHSFDGLTPDTFRRAKEKVPKGVKRDGPKIGDLYRQQEYRYRDQDDPADLVRLQPLLTSRKLNIVPADAHARSSFAGAKIYYGFTVDPKANDRMVQGLREPGANDLWHDIAAITDSPLLLGRGKPGTAYGLDTPEKLQELARKIDKAALNYRGEPEETAYRKLSTMVRTAVQRIQDHNLKNIAGLEATADDVGRKDEDEPGKQHIRHAGLSLAGKIKDPQTPAEKEMSAKVIQLASEYWTRMRPSGYDLLVYPQSRTPFNSHFIAALRHHPGYAQAEVVELRKLLAHETRINIDEIWAWAQSEHDNPSTGRNTKRAIAKKYLPGGTEPINQAHLSQFYAAGLELNLTPRTDAAGNIPVSSPDWVDWRTALTASQLEGELAGHKPQDVVQMKTVEARANKRYLDLFTSDGLDAAGKRVLIVDDNVAYSATMQALNDLVTKQNPASVDLYTPFYMQT